MGRSDNWAARAGSMANQSCTIVSNIQIGKTVVLEPVFLNAFEKRSNF